jgi:hypothetical protein
LSSCKSLIGKISAEEFEAKESQDEYPRAIARHAEVQGKRARRYGSSAAPEGGDKVVSIAALKLALRHCSRKPLKVVENL